MPYAFLQAVVTEFRPLSTLVRRAYDTHLTITTHITQAEDSEPMAFDRQFKPILAKLMVRAFLKCSTHAILNRDVM